MHRLLSSCLGYSSLPEDLQNSKKIQETAGRLSPHIAQIACARTAERIETALMPRPFLCLHTRFVFALFRLDQLSQPLRSICSACVDFTSHNVVPQRKRNRGRSSNRPITQERCRGPRTQVGLFLRFTLNSIVVIVYMSSSRYVYRLLSMPLSLLSTFFPSGLASKVLRMLIRNLAQVIRKRSTEYVSALKWMCI